jgi:putative GTP pyrophosphokinase
MAALTESRAKLLEFRIFKEFIFEIQICTSLRHTWNQIEHDRKYKVGTELPKDLSRKINRLSEIIDDADMQLNEFSARVDKLVRSSLTERELRRPLYSSDLARYLTKTFRRVRGFQMSFGKKSSKDVIQEMRTMGLKKILDLKKITPFNLKQIYRRVSRPDDYFTFSLIIRGDINNGKMIFLYGEESRELSEPVLNASLLLLKQIDNFFVSSHKI